MKVAIAGTGDFAKYLFEEVSTFGHDVVVLTRSKKPNNELEQRETDYTVPSLVEVLEDRDVLISTVADYAKPENTANLHLVMLEALKQSRRCKSFIPSEWTMNVEEYPEQPMFIWGGGRKLHSALSSQNDIKYTIVCLAGFADYVNPAKNRYLRDVGPIWPMDHKKKEFTIYGPGTQIIGFTAARDVAKAVALLVASQEPWETYTYMVGQHITWNDLYAMVKKRDPAWTTRSKTLAATVNQIVENKDPRSVFFAQFELLGYSGALQLNAEKVEKHREKYFKGLHFRTVEEVLEAAAKNPNQIV